MLPVDYFYCPRITTTRYGHVAAAYHWEAAWELLVITSLYLIKKKFSYCWNNLWVQQHLMLPSVYPNLQYISDNEMRQGSWSVTGIPWNIIGESNRNYSRPGAELLIFLYPLPPLPMLMLMLAPMSMYTHAVGRRALMLAWQGLLLALIIMICSIKIVR